MKSHEGRDVFLPDERVMAFTNSGAWIGKTLAELFDAHAAKTPERVAAVSYSDPEHSARRSMTFAELKRLSERIATDLIAKGIGLGDIVSMQLPNRHEALAICLACSRIGAVINPLMPVLRHRELRHILSLTEAKCIYVPNRFRGFDYGAMARSVADEIGVAGFVEPLSEKGFDWSTARKVMSETDWIALRPDANELFQVMFTSGTTGEPKGAMHTANTLVANVVELQRRFEISSEDVLHCPTPVAHQLGFLFGILLPCLTGARVVFQEVWEKDQALGILERDGATLCVGATPFLADVVGHPELPKKDLRRFRLFVSGGAPIPSALVEQGVRNLDAKVISIWGMTEVLAITTVKLDDPDERAANSDGVATRHTAIRIVDENGAPVRNGIEGRLEAKGATVCLGYLKRPELYSIQDGWFDTGDLARMDDDGYIRITGRSKDIIIRGGENIPVVEIEGLLFKHSSIAQAAIVAMPDARLGERACLFAVPKDGSQLTLKLVQDYLLEQGVAKVYLPEFLEMLEAMPVTATGKIQKFTLREKAGALAAALVKQSA